MNRPTIDVEELLDMADEALLAGDVQEAVGMLRKASSVAPLRKDIRNKLAVVLERGGSGNAPAVTQSWVDDSIASGFADDADSEVENRESLAQFARRAFEAASAQSSKAGVATRRLTNILQTGLSSWKNLRADEAKQPVAEAVPSNVFEPEQDLQAYLDRVRYSEAEDIDDELDNEVAEPEVSRITRPSTDSQKEARSAPRKKSGRPSEVEDVLAAGIGGFIEAAGKLSREKLAYSVVYTLMIALFAYACFDTSRKFAPSGTGVLAGRGATASASAFAAQAMPVTEQAREHVRNKEFAQAIALLQGSLESGTTLAEREPLRAELAATYNVQGEEWLKSNKIDQSVESYRQALKYAPADVDLQIRLANAIYYYALTQDGTSKKESLREATDILTKCLVTRPGEVQAHRLLAMVYDGRGLKQESITEWEKVRSLSVAGSSISAEAESRLK